MAKWHHVTNPPKTEGKYLVYDFDGDKYIPMGISPYRVSWWDGKRWAENMEGLIDYWMELPPPPKDENRH